MKTTSPWTHLFLSGILVASLSSCDLTVQQQDNYTYLWLGAIQDAHVTSLIPEANYDGNFSLVTAHGAPNGEQRTYIEFFMPQLPSGSEVVEAYINVYEDSQTGQTGASGIEIGTAQAAWDAFTLTWNNQPNPAGPSSVGTTLEAFDGRNKWRGSGNVKNLVQQQLDNPASSFGWILNHSAAIAFTRSFTSMNALSPQGRTQTTLDFGPRLLLKVRSDVPLSSSNIGTSISGANELGSMYGTGVNILVFNLSTGSDWPASWDVATN